MNWIRDNILKIVIGIFVAIVLVVILLVVFYSGKEPVDSASGYIELENRLQNAAISYVKEHPNVLPKTTDTIKKIKLDTLIEAGKINKVHAVDDNNITCKGYVEIEKIDDEGKDYRYIPYLSCGKYYVTSTIADYIINKETQNGEFNRTSDDGLYALNDGYIYRGEYPENYIFLGDHMYRIMGIDSEKHLKLISAQKTTGRYIFDDRYNISINKNYGINDFSKSRLYDTLNFLYENTIEEEGEIFFNDLEKTYIIEHDFCIGKRDLNDVNIYSGAECSATIPLKVGLIAINEYPLASIDPNCNAINAPSCKNYNYLVYIDSKNYYPFLSLTGVANNTYEIYKFVDDNLEITSAHRAEPLLPVIYISDRVIYKAGSGTYLDPYIVR